MNYSELSMNVPSSMKQAVKYYKYTDKYDKQAVKYYKHTDKYNEQAVKLSSSIRCTL